MNAGRSAHLMVLRGPDLGALHRLDGEEIVVGGDPFRSEVVLRDGQVEPEEARIFAGPGGSTPWSNWGRAARSSTARP